LPPTDETASAVEEERREILGRIDREKHLRPPDSRERVRRP